MVNRQDSTVSETWLKRDVAAAHDWLRANPERALTLAQIQASLAALHEQFIKRD